MTITSSLTLLVTFCESVGRGGGQAGREGVCHMWNGAHDISEFAGGGGGGGRGLALV